MYNPKETLSLLKKGMLLKTLQRDLRMEKSPFDRAFRDVQVAYSKFMRAREEKLVKEKATGQVLENYTVVLEASHELRVALYEMTQEIQKIGDMLPAPSKEEKELMPKKVKQTNQRMVNPFYGKNIKF
jgi:hypothetical protein